MVERRTREVLENFEHEFILSCTILVTSATDLTAIYMHACTYTFFVAGRLRGIENIKPENALFGFQWKLLRNRPLEETAASPRPQQVEGGLIAARLARLAGPGPRVEEQALGFLEPWLGVCRLEIVRFLDAGGKPWKA